jgi:hypothetical protein
MEVWESSYLTFGNNPVKFIDPLGDEKKTTFVDKNNKVLSVINDGKTDVIKLKNIDYQDWKGYLSNSDNKPKSDKIFTALSKGSKASNIGNTIFWFDFMSVNEGTGKLGEFPLLGSTINNYPVFTKKQMDKTLVYSKWDVSEGVAFGYQERLVNTISESFSKALNSSLQTTPLNLMTLAMLSQNGGPFDIKNTILLPNEGYPYTLENGKNIFTTGRAIGNITFGKNLLVVANNSTVSNEVIWRSGMRAVGEYNHKSNGTPYNKYYGEHPYSGAFIKYGFKNIKDKPF